MQQLPPELADTIHLLHVSSSLITHRQLLGSANSCNNNSCNWQVQLPCGAAPYGGAYRLQLLASSSQPAASELVQVSWPPLVARLPAVAPSLVTTVTGHVRLAVSVCPPLLRDQPRSVAHFTTSVRRLNDANYCNDTSDTWRPVSKLKDLLLRGGDVQLTCEHMPRPGEYQLRVVAAVGTERHLVACSNTMKVSRELQLNLRSLNGHSVFPCTTGVQVYYRRPVCVGVRDTVRVYAILRAAVASATPPLTRHYVGERHLVVNYSALNIDCAWFSEKFLRYCFTYTTIDVSGSTADLATRCLRTHPATVVRNGSFGQWSSWTPCSSDCGRSTRVRYRFCNNPAPSNSGRFCQGETVQWKQCLRPPCFSRPTAVSPAAAAALPTNHSCLCGCQLRLACGQSVQLAAAGVLDSCGNSSRRQWRLQASGSCTLSVFVLYVWLPGSSDSDAELLLRDGWSSAHKLLARFRHATTAAPSSGLVASLGQLSVEYMVPSVMADDRAGFVINVSALNGALTTTKLWHNSVGAVRGTTLREARSMIYHEMAPQVTAGAFIGCIFSITLALWLYSMYLLHKPPPKTASCDSLLPVMKGTGSVLTSHTSLRESSTSTSLRSVRLQPRRQQRTSSCDMHELVSHWTTSMLKDRLPAASSSAPRASTDAGESLALAPLHRPAHLAVAADCRRSGSLSSSVATAGCSQLELDYYDYDVTNAARAPGSYFGGRLNQVTSPVGVVNWHAASSSATPTDDVTHCQDGRPTDGLDANTSADLMDESTGHGCSVITLANLTYVDDTSSGTDN